MGSTRLYFDYNATAPVLDQAREAMIKTLQVIGNPSSVHQEGREARSFLSRARAQVAQLVGGENKNVIFTSGATEAANTLLCPHYRSQGKDCHFSKLYIGSTEHACVRAGGRFASADVCKIPVNMDGIVNIEALEELLQCHEKTSGRPLVAVQAANNESGVLQPLEKISEIVKRNDGLLIVDAVQIVGKLAFYIEAGLVDFIFISSHKIGGPKGVGAIIGFSNKTMPIPLIRGGGQENGYRAGTEALPLIAGFGAATQYVWEALKNEKWTNSAQKEIENFLKVIVPKLVIYGENVPRLPNTTFFSCHVKAENIINFFGFGRGCRFFGFGLFFIWARQGQSGDKSNGL